MANEIMNIQEQGNALALTTQEQIQAHIYTIRGMQVMLDKDLAVYYGITTSALNQAVKRNIDRFPEDFMFQLTKEEATNLQSILMSQNVMSSLKSQNVILNEEDGSLMPANVKLKRGQHTFEHSHDRWLIIDKTVYHFGASIKDLGKRWFSVDMCTEYTADELLARL